jgi:diacylglycerol kinase (ATP)
MRALLIHHAGAGAGATSREALTDALEEAGWKVDYLARKKTDAKKIKKADPDLIVIAGGDGTVAGVLAMLPDRTVPVAIIPTGSANNIARSVGITGDPLSVIAGWDLKRRRRFDIGNADGPWGCRTFAEGVGFGAFADSLRRSPKADGVEKIRVGRRAFRSALADARPLPLEIEVDGEELPDGLILIEAMNVPMSGPRLPFAPGADPGDGKLHVAWLREDARGAMLDWLEGDRDTDAPVEQRSGTAIAIRCGDAPMRIDDAFCTLPAGSAVTLRIESEPVQLLAPPDQQALMGESECRT